MSDTIQASRRAFLKRLAAATALLTSGPLLAAKPNPDVLVKPIPSTQFPLPLIGMGTSITFNVGDDIGARDARTEVLRAFFDLGGGIIDSSPMYGSSEAVLGYGLERLKQARSNLFSATKVWTPRESEGPLQVANSGRLWGVDRFDLLQVHNLVAWREHLAMLLQMKAEGHVSYVGVTTSHGRRHGELEQVMRTQPLDFVQLTYNILDREAEQRLLPLAAERGIAVIANRPFRRGELVDRLEREPLPEWAQEIDCHNWPQFLLKFIISHPAITCAIPATSQVEHMHENMGAMTGRLPDDRWRRRMVDYVRSL